MATLTKDTMAMQINGITKQEIGECRLEAGQRCKVKSRYRDAFGQRWVQIEINGYLYDVLPNDITEED